LVRVAAGGKNDINDIFAKYAAGGPAAAAGGAAQPAPVAKPSTGSAPTSKAPGLVTAGGAASLLHCGTGLMALLLVNAGVYAAAVWGGKAATVASMVLPAVNAKWWQFVSSAFVHASAEHAARNLAVVWLAGSAVARELGGPGIWFAYALGALGANLSAVWLMPVKVKAAGGLLGVAATGGAVSLAAVALLLGLRPTLGYLLSALAFVQLALAPLLRTPVPGGPSAALPLPHELWGAWVGSGLSGLKGVLRSASADPGLTWLWGALAAAVLVFGMARFPDGSDA